MLKSKIASSNGGIRNFFSGMLPNFEKSRLINDLSQSHKELSILKEKYTNMPDWAESIITDTVPALSRTMLRSADKWDGNISKRILDVITLRLSESTDMERFVDGLYGPVILKDVMDYRKVNTVRLVAVIPFFIDYANRLSNVAVSMAIYQMQKAKKLPAKLDVTTKDDIEFVKNLQNIQSFVSILNVLILPMREISSMLSKASKMSFNVETHALVAKEDPKKVDPLHFNMLPVIGSVVYHIGLVINTYYASKQESLNEELERMQVQLVMLRRMEDSTMEKRDLAKLEKQIKYYSNRINKIRSVLEDMVDD